ncbi:hypothetical protein STANM309S_00387 [Streptomyces tanashiensis]
MEEAGRPLEGTSYVRFVSWLASVAEPAHVSVGRPMSSYPVTMLLPPVVVLTARSRRSYSVAVVPLSGSVALF